MGVNNSKTIEKGGKTTQRRGSLSPTSPSQPQTKPFSGKRRRSNSLPSINDQVQVSYNLDANEKSQLNSWDFNPKPKDPPPRAGNIYEIHPGMKVVVGIYEYSSNTTGDLSFQKGERMVVLKQEGEWYCAKSCSNGREGYIPSNYVAVEMSLDKFDWYHGNITRQKAEKYLHAPGNILHTFLIRESNSDGAEGYALSVLDENDDRQKVVRHFRIRKRGDQKGFFLETTKPFQKLEDLVQHYQKDNSDETSRVVLSRPCAKAKPTLMELSKDKWEICRSELEFEEKLGAGKFGEVHRGRWRNKPVAIKTLKEGSMDPAKFLDEAAIMKRLRHRKLVALYAVCSNQQPFYIITELMSNGCLLDYLKNDRGRQLHLPNLIDIAGQISDGMMFIESKEVVHRDLAARNVLVGDMNHVKIGDFGLAKAAKDVANIDKNESFPVKWTAPEAMREGRFTIKSDVWSFGILLVELMTYGEVPYPTMKNKEALQFVEQGRRHSCPPNCPESIYDIMLSCWNKRPEQRPSFEALYGMFEDFAIGDPNGQYQ